MYLRIYNYNVEPEKLTENYVGWVIYNLFRDHCKKIKDLSFDYVYSTERIDDNDKQGTLENTILVEPPLENDFDDKDLRILNMANKLKWWEQQLLIHSYDKSLRQIEREFNINYQFVRRHTNKAKKKILGEDYKEKKNGKRTA
jgi:hypothetical protein